jgi:hypothetical protein
VSIRRTWPGAGGTDVTIGGTGFNQATVSLSGSMADPSTSWIRR